MIDVTPLILTFNEKENIGRSLMALSWAKQIVIIDSGSNDETLEIARSSHPNVRVLTRAFDSFANQCNFGLSQVDTEWVLSLDADYVLTPEVVAEIERLHPDSSVAGYAAEFRYCIQGHPLRSSVYPSRTVLYRRQLARYRDEGHGHRVEINGRIEQLRGKIDHDDRKPFSRWTKEQIRYARVEAKHLVSTPLTELNSQDRLRRMILFAAPAMFFYLLFGRGLILDGRSGWIYVGERTTAELFLSARLLKEQIHRFF